MDFISPALQKYSEDHTSPESVLLAEINRNTYAKVMQPRMLSGHLQGRVLAMISHMIKPQRILEIGTYTGYSALCLAEGLTADGLLISIDANEEFLSIAQKNIAAANTADKLKLIHGDALSIVPNLNLNFDLIFIDANKEAYPAYFEICLSACKPGGFILADNVLWSGNVIKPLSQQDEETEHIHAFNTKVQECEAVENVLLPVRDGIMLIRKK
ncbi:MAG: O-methyltransferase [Bacteroidetes bacterium]|nr:O-methyltransferase [Bacteroidota bacterium]